MTYALLASHTARVAAAARGARRAVPARRTATVAVRASSRTDDVAVSVRATRAIGGLASVAAVAAAPAAPAHAAASEFAQVRRFSRSFPAPGMHLRDRVSYPLSPPFASAFASASGSSATRVSTLKPKP